MNKGQGNRNGTQIVRPKPTTKNQPKTKQQQPKQKIQKCPKKGGVKIGQSKQDSNKWRCKTCKRLTDKSIYECHFCGDPRYQKQQKQGQEDDRPLRADQYDE